MDRFLSEHFFKFWSNNQKFLNLNFSFSLFIFIQFIYWISLVSDKSLERIILRLLWKKWKRYCCQERKLCRIGEQFIALKPELWIRQFFGIRNENPDGICSHRNIIQCLRGKVGFFEKRNYLPFVQDALSFLILWVYYVNCTRLLCHTIAAILSERIRVRFTRGSGSATLVKQQW